jgi:hypothetical protein
MHPKIRHRQCIISMCWEDNQKHTVPKGMAIEQFNKCHTKFHAYYIVNAKEVVHLHMGSVCPFATCCIGCHHEFGENLVNVAVGVPEDLMPGRTPVLGWCACITCLNCVYSMPLEHGLSRRCRVCWDAKAHQNTYHMYPVTIASIGANNEKGKSMIAARKERNGKKVV